MGREVFEPEHSFLNLNLTKTVIPSLVIISSEKNKFENKMGFDYKLYIKFCRNEIGKEGHVSNV